MKFLEQFTLITDIIFGLMILLYLYQIVYIAVSMFKRKVPKLPDAKKNHRYAIFISARNEKGVIGELLDSLRNQTYRMKCTICMLWRITVRMRLRK